MDKRVVLKQKPMPVEWALLDTYTSSGTWVCPKTGWYRFHAIGKGGTGGDGGEGFVGSTDFCQMTYEDDGETPTGCNFYGQWWNPGGGGGGSAGGCAVSIYYCRKGEKLSIGYNGNATVIGTIKNAVVNMKGNAGNTGSTGNPAYKTSGYYYNGAGGSGGSGGTASGGNVANNKGQTGNTGNAGRAAKQYESTPEDDGYYAPSDQPSAARGGTGGKPITVSSNVPSTVGVGGTGGLGGLRAYDYTNAYYPTDAKYKDTPATTGSTGTAGGIFIEWDKENS